MNTNLQTQAKEKINELLGNDYSPFEIKIIAESIECRYHSISFALAEVICKILSENRVYSA